MAGEIDRYRVSLASRRRRILAIVGLTWAASLVAFGFDLFAHLVSRPRYNDLAATVAFVAFGVAAVGASATASTIPRGFWRRVGAAVFGAVGALAGCVLLFLACTSALWVFVPIRP